MPFVENAPLINERLPCPACVGNDGLCCADGKTRPVKFESERLRTLLDIRRIEHMMQSCAIRAQGAKSACVQSASDCVKQHVGSYVRHAAENDGAPNAVKGLPTDAILDCHRKTVEECGYDGSKATPCSLKCVLGRNPDSAAEAERTLSKEDLPAGCTLSRLMQRSFS